VVGKRGDYLVSLRLAKVLNNGDFVTSDEDNENHSQKGSQR
jgi:hypothetical protein